MLRMMVVCACAMGLWGMPFASGEPRGAIAEGDPVLEPPAPGEPFPDFDPTDCGECEEDQPCCCPCPFLTIARGEVSGFHLHDPAFRGARIVIRTPQAWLRFWALHTSNLDPPPPPPPVDFTHSVVLVAAQGLRPHSGGADIEFTAVDRCEDVTRARIKVHNRRGPVESISNPFHIVQIPIACAPCLNAVAFVSHRPRVHPGAVVGQVRAAEVPGTHGELLPGANVRLVHPGPDPDVVAETVTNEDGFYHLDDILPGQYVVIATAEGYAPAAATVAVFPGRPSHRDLVLLPPPPLGDEPPGAEPAYRDSPLGE